MGGRGKRPSTFRLLRAIWRYRRRVAGHGDRYQVELATTVRTALHGRAAGRLALGAYRAAMRVLLVGAIVLGVLGLVAAWLLWQLEPWAALASLLLLVPAVALGWWRLAWGAPLDWLDEHADPDREVALTELPGRLRAVASELRELADVPASLSRELDVLAGDIDAETSSAS